MQYVSEHISDLPETSNELKARAIGFAKERRFYRDGINAFRESLTAGERARLLEEKCSFPAGKKVGLD